MRIFTSAVRCAIAAAIAVPAIAACTSSSPAASRPASRDLPGEPGTVARICGQPVLNSPFHYAGPAGAYRSGTAGLPTYGSPGSDFPHDTAGVVLPPGSHGYMSYDLSPDTVYYLLPGEHVGFFQADTNDAFVGGLADGKRTVLSGNYSGLHVAIDSNFSNGNQSGVTIEYLTIEKFQPNGDAAAINQGSNTNWTVQYNTITLNVPGAGLIAGADNTLKHNCLTLNGQYGFQSSDVGTWGNDSLTGGPYNVTVADNEISYNDTCDFEGTFSNQALGWSKHNPVPARYQNPHCGAVSGDGNQGGFKLWATNGVTIEGNYIHNNWGPGIWADTDNANTTYVGNTITDNDGQAIIEEISYNFSIVNNYLAGNGWAVGLSNPGFPTPAIYISESGSDTAFGGIPACREPSCARQGAYQDRSVIGHNILVDNGGSVLLWQNSDRFCSGQFDNVCTLVAGGRSGPFTMTGCKANIRSAATDTTAFLARRTGSPSLDWWNGCLWKTENVSVTSNTVYFNPADITGCGQATWPDCGAGGMFSEYGISAPYDSPGGWVIASQLTFFQGNAWAGNVYYGPSAFYAWNQGNGDNPVSWSAWTGHISGGDKCGSAGEHQSGACSGPFGQDSGSTYRSKPSS